MADYARSEELRRLREKRHWSQETAAHEIGVTTRTLREWEKGGAIKWVNAKRAGRTYGVDPERLVSREQVNDPDEAEAPATDDERDLLLAMQTQIRELIGGQAALHSEMEKVSKSLRALRDSQRRSGRPSRGSGSG